LQDDQRSLSVGGRLPEGKRSLAEAVAGASLGSDPERRRGPCARNGYKSRRIDACGRDIDRGRAQTSVGVRCWVGFDAALVSKVLRVSQPPRMRSALARIGTTAQLRLFMVCMSSWYAWRLVDEWIDGCADSLPEPRSAVPFPDSLPEESKTAEMAAGSVVG